jgi:hypothetical protein
MTELYDYLPFNMVGRLMFASNESTLREVSFLTEVSDKVI